MTNTNSNQSNTTDLTNLDRALEAFSKGIKTFGCARENARKEAYASVCELEGDGLMVVSIEDDVVIVTF